MVVGNINILSDLGQSPPATLPGAQALWTRQTLQFQVAPGTGTDQADRKYAKILTLAASPISIDLTALVDVFGNAFSLARAKSILIVNQSTTDPVTVGYATATANAWTGLLSNPGTIVIPPSTAINQGAFLFLAPSAAGWPVSSTSRLMLIDPGSATLSVAVEIVGASV